MGNRRILVPSSHRIQRARCLETAAAADRAEAAGRAVAAAAASLAWVDAVFWSKKGHGLRQNQDSVRREGTALHGSSYLKVPEFADAILVYFRKV